MPRPFENITDNNVSTIDELMNYSNTVVGPAGTHYYGDLMVMTLWVVVTGAAISRYNDSSALVKSVMVGSFVSLVFAFMLNIGGHVDQIAVGFPLAGLLISLALHKISEEYT